jgi:hypothetical protein
MSDKSKWDTMDWRDWLYTQSEDSIATELKCQYDELTTLRSLVQEMLEIIDCPFCSAKAVKKVEWLASTTYDFACGTEGTPQGFKRSDECYKRQRVCLYCGWSDELTALRSLVWKIYEIAEEAPLMSTANEIQEILNRPEVKEIMEEKP